MFILHLEIIAMAVLVLLIGISLLVAIGFLMSFFWSVKDGQYDDDYTPSVRVLFDEELLENQSKK